MAIHSNIQEPGLNGKLVATNGEYEIAVYSNLDGIGGVAKSVLTEPIVISGMSLYKQYNELNTFDGTKSIDVSSTIEGTGAFEVEGKAYSISFKYPSEQGGTEELNQLVEEFDQILSTFMFLGVTSSPDSTSSPGGLVESQACGGLAGTPCPGGYTCQLEDDSSEGGGVCVKNSL